MTSPAYPPVRLSWIVWGLGALFYFTGFYQRVAPAVMTDQLMRDFEIGATALGHFSAFYFYSYVAMQIPTGVLADHWGPRKLLTAGALVAALGTLLFALGQHLIVANMGRLLIGGSVAVAWVTLLKLSTHWFPPHRFATVTGVALLFGVAGAVFAGVPLRFLVEWFGWRGVMVIMSLFTLGVAIGVWVVVRDDPSEAGYRSYAHYIKIAPGPTPGNILAGLKQAVMYRNTLLLTLAPGGLVGSVLAFCGLWGVPYLAARYQLSQSASAAITSAIMLAWAAGGPALGAFSDRICRRKAPYLVAIVTTAAAWLIALYVDDLPLGVFVAFAMLAGFASGGIIIGFAFVKESVPAELAGTASGICNMGVMSGPMILQPAIGWILDLQWKGTVQNGVHVYDLAAYKSGFLLMIGWLVIAALLVCFTAETHCRQKVLEQGKH
jgi:MFS family permease